MVKASFLVPTYHRAYHEPDRLGELAYWFTRQTLAGCEMVVLNDHPATTLVCRVPGVRVVNLPFRLPSLGAKRNLLVALARGEVCLPQDDDDVPLPHRAEQAVAMLADYDYWSPRGFFYHETATGRFRPDGGGVGHNHAAYRRAAFLGRYEDTSAGDDARAHAWAAANLRVNPRRAVPSEFTYVYRWSGNARHISGHGPARMDAAYAAMDPGPGGVREVVPGRRHDYDHLVTEYGRNP